MNISFQCDVCFKTLSANAIAAGRVITCPYCHKTTKIPLTGEDERRESKIPTSTEEQNQERPDSSSSSNVSQWRDPTFDPDWEKMLEKFPAFKPNPFGISFPLDKAIQEAGLQDEFDEENGESDGADAFSSQYSVDDLIKGVE